nr:type I secretion C-terminal target domain-containing protein [Candidatus Dactylopiibacterium carminicum]
MGLRDATPATVNLNVLTVDDGTPVAVGDRFSTLLGTPITLTTAQLLSNDTLFDNARITATGSVSGGALVNNGDGTWTFTPSAIGTGTGTGSFTYTLTDDDGQTSTATVSITAYSGIDDLATVYESALPGGTGGGTTVATGNLLANDGNTSASITSVAGVTDGSANDTDTRAGYIGIDTAHGHLVVNTSGSGSGDYVYTLKSLADNSAPANNNSLTESIAYTTSNGSTAHLQVSIIDDRPQTVSRTVQVAEASQPDYNLLLVLDTSRSMTLAEAGGVVQSQAAGGSVSLTTRLDMAKIAMKNLISQYFDQASSVTVHLVTFGPSGTLVSYGGTTTFTSKTAALAAIDSISVSADGGTNYEAGLTAARKALDANSNGVVDNTSAQTVSYFISDGAPTSSNTNTATSAWNTFTANNGIQSYAIGVGSGITASTALNTIHNVDADSSGTRDSAIIIPDLNDLSGTLTNSVPTGYGGNVITDGQGSLTSALGADGGYIKTLTVKLDTDANGTADTNVTFSYNANSHQISWAGGHPAGSPISGDTLNLTSARGFTQGTLNFNFATGGYTYYTGGSASEGSSFSLSFVATDGDGDLTQPTTLTFAVVDGHPIARPDFDTLAPNGTSFTGNVITGLDTNSGLAEGTLVTDFTARGSSADTIVDNAHVTSIVFQGHTFNLAAANSGNVLGGSYTVNASGTLTWTHASNGSSLVFNSAGYYNYTPAKADLPNPPTSSTISVDLDWTPSASSGLSVTGRDENGNNASITYPNNLLTFWNNGAGVTGQGVNNSAMSSDVRNSPNRYLDALETMVFTFNSATHPHGVENLRFVINADNSNLGDRTSVGGASSLTYSVYHIDGHLLGTFTSTDEGTVTLPPEFSNVGSVEVQAASDTYARISGISYQSILTDDCDTVVAPVVIGYTLTDSDGDTSSSTLTLRSYTNALTGDDGNNTLNGTDVNDQLSGGGGNDVLNGGAGHDLLSGGHGNDILNGGSGDDFLFGGHGNDILNGGSGNDRLVGGAGNDVLTGGTGSDVFVWQLGDRGTVGTPAVDTITDFDKTTASGDALNLRDLLQGEQHSGTDLGNLTNYLHFTVAAGSTTIQISSQGAFGNGYNAAAVDQQIVLQGVDLSNGGSLANDQSIIQDLLNKGKLHVD